MTHLTPWEIKRIHTLALLQQSNITLWDGWRVCDPIGDGPILQAVREFAKTYKVKDLDIRSGLFGKPKPQLTLAMPDPKNPPLWMPRRSSMKDILQKMLENTCTDGDVCIYALPTAFRGVWKKELSPDVFAIPDSPFRWWVFGRNRSSTLKMLDMRGIE